LRVDYRLIDGWALPTKGRKIIYEVVIRPKNGGFLGLLEIIPDV
jgi:hypothetical protein